MVKVSYKESTRSTRSRSRPKAREGAKPKMAKGGGQGRGMGKSKGRGKGKGRGKAKVEEDCKDDDDVEEQDEDDDDEEEQQDENGEEKPEDLLESLALFEDDDLVQSKIQKAASKASFVSGFYHKAKAAAMQKCNNADKAKQVGRLAFAAASLKYGVDVH
jgi:hypothetical protein